MLRNLSFSFIIPTFNRAYIISRAIDSVLNQLGEHDIEIIIVDDGSTDDTAAVIKSYATNKISYFYQKNAGPSAARNLGLKQSTKEFVVYLDSDNLLLPNYLNVLSKTLLDNPGESYVMVRARKTKELYQAGELIKTFEDKENNLLETSLAALCRHKTHYFDVNGFAHARSYFSEGIHWDENISHLEDWEFLMQLAKSNPNGFLYIPEAIVHYYMRLGGTDSIISRALPREWASAFEYIYQKHKEDTLLQGQTWYPARVQKYLKQQELLDQGKGEMSYMEFFK